MDNEITNPSSQHTLLNREDLSGLRRIALLYGGGQLLKYVKGEWQVNETVVNGDEYVFRVDLLAHGWVEWVGGEIGRKELVFHNQTPKERRELDCHDESLWETGNDGKKKDPWQFEFLMPCENKEGDRFGWPTSSDGGMRAVGRLAEKYAGKGGRFMPLVRLETSSYSNKRHGGRTDVPVLTVMKWIPRESGDLPAIAAPDAASIHGTMVGGRPGITVTSGPQPPTPARQPEPAMDDGGPGPNDELITW
jgi:hypothetical protein